MNLDVLGNLGDLRSFLDWASKMPGFHQREDAKRLQAALPDEESEDQDWAQFKLDLKERIRIEDTHSWQYICFPPGPTTCIICHANKADPGLQPCLTASIHR